MVFLPFTKMFERLENSKQESDSAYFLDLLYCGEMITKTIISGMISSVIDDKNRNRYRLSHRVVRADGIGEWSSVLDDLLTGLASQFLDSDVRMNEMHELTVKSDTGTWQYESVNNLLIAMKSIGDNTIEIPKKIQAKIWFLNFAKLRNSTRGHGALLPGEYKDACIPLENSIKLIVNNFYLFKRQWAFLYENISGKYRVSKLGLSSSHFDDLKPGLTNSAKFDNGLYIFFQRKTAVDLISTTADIEDFYFPNGNFREKEFELISYISGKIKYGDSSRFLIPVNELPSSETEGLGELEVIGKTFSNIPPIYENYVHRKVLEDELYKVISENSRYPIITLKGLGGIGKTSLALSVLHKITVEERFDVILWFSSRDIDLTAQGVKHVKNKILNEEDISSEFAELVGRKDLKKTNEKVNFLSQEMSHSSNGPTLFVFDNFETVKNPIELFSWIDTYIRLPNKVLITSRTSKNFKADYPIEVSGMTYVESEILIKKTAEEFEIKHLLENKDIEKIIQESNGHPYVIRIFLSEIAKNKKVGDIKRIVASKDEILTALFRRTYSSLTSAAKRVFLTLCSWRSVIPQIALEAVMLREENEKINIDDIIDELRMSSFVDVTNSDKDSETFLSVPFSAFIFGKSELEVSSQKFAIQADSKLLQDFGAAQQSQIAQGITPQIIKKFKSIVLRINSGKEKLESHLPTLEFLARKYPEAWNYLADIHEENGDIEKAHSAKKEFLKSDVEDKRKQTVWQEFADYYRKKAEYFNEVTALVEICTLTSCDFTTISSIVNTINNYFQKFYFEIDSEVKKEVTRKLVDLMNSKVDNEVNATDYSRLGWLYLHLKKQEEALEVAKKGLEKDPNNLYCLKLVERLRANSF